MNIAIIGYGKMGKAIEEIALSKSHKISAKINSENASDARKILSADHDIAIEFSNPDVAFDNIKTCMELGIPCVSGSTGWLDKFHEIEDLCKANKSAFFYASNFSVGVNIFFALNEKLAEMMNSFSEYNSEIEETHHIHKKDAPSGTAISIAEGIIAKVDRYKDWVLEGAEKDKINIIAHRKDEVPGTHLVKYNSDIDDIEIKHVAHSRKGFAQGAVLAAEWLHGKEGIFGMKDLLKL